MTMAMTKATAARSVVRVKALSTPRTANRPPFVTSGVTPRPDEIKRIHTASPTAGLY